MKYLIGAYLFSAPRSMAFFCLSSTINTNEELEIAVSVMLLTCIASAVTRYVFERDEQELSVMNRLLSPLALTSSMSPKLQNPSTTWAVPQLL